MPRNRRRGNGRGSSSAWREDAECPRAGRGRDPQSLRSCVLLPTRLAHFPGHSPDPAPRPSPAPTAEWASVPPKDWAPLSRGWGERWAQLSVTLTQGHTQPAVGPSPPRAPAPGRQGRSARLEAGPPGRRQPLRRPGASPKRGVRSHPPPSAPGGRAWLCRRATTQCSRMVHLDPLENQGHLGPPSRPNLHSPPGPLLSPPICTSHQPERSIHSICDFLLHIWLLGWLASSPRKVGGLFRLIPCIPST